MDIRRGMAAVAVGLAATGAESMTREQIVGGADARIPVAGALAFRGFQGRYRVRAVVNNQVVQGGFELVDEGRGTTRVVMGGQGDGP